MDGRLPGTRFLLGILPDTLDLGLEFLHASLCPACRLSIPLRLLAQGIAGCFEIPVGLLKRADLRAQASRLPILALRRRPKFLQFVRQFLYLPAE